MQEFNNWIVSIKDAVWGVPMIVLILAVGVLLTIRLRLIQIRHLPKALRFMLQTEENGEGEVSSFGALCTALSATIGTGNIVGVATAIGLGGPGALFWMCLAAFFGMATKYAEGLLAIKYRDIDSDGHVLGGTFYYIERGLRERFHRNFKWLAMLFAFFGAAAGLLGIGTITQINGISSAAEDFFDPGRAFTVTLFGVQYSWVVVITAIVVTLCVGLVVIGGIKRISSVSQIVVPFMVIIYLLGSIIVLAVNVQQIPHVFSMIFTNAFTGTAAVGGFAGAAFREVIQSGIARGVFSNESGLGSAPIAAAAAKTEWPARQGLVSMTGTFIDTIIVCNLTGFCILSSGSWLDEGVQGVLVTSHAFQSGFFFAPALGQFLLMLCLIFFAFTTILGWNYYGERCMEYLFHKQTLPVKIYRWLYVLAVFVGPFLSVEFVWNIADVFNGLMAFPNLVALFLLSGVIAKETSRFFDFLEHDTSSLVRRSKEQKK